MIAVYKNNITDVKTRCEAFKRKKCYGKPVWAIFTGDGKPYMSRLKAFSCATHLSRTILRIMEEENSLTTILDDKDTFTEEEFEV
jgi:hypothetical protein